MELLYHLFTDPHVPVIINTISIVIVATKFVPALRVIGIGLQLLLTPFEMFRDYLISHEPHPKQIGYTNLEQSNG